MKCNQCPEHECNNENLDKCKKCESPMLCLCERPEVQEMVKKLWSKENNNG